MMHCQKTVRKVSYVGVHQSCDAASAQQQSLFMTCSLHTELGLPLRACFQRTACTLPVAGELCRRRSMCAHTFCLKLRHVDVGSTGSCHISDGSCDSRQHPAGWRTIQRQNQHRCVCVLDCHNCKIVYACIGQLPHLSCMNKDRTDSGRMHLWQQPARTGYVQSTYHHACHVTEVQRTTSAVGMSNAIHFRLPGCMPVGDGIR